MLLQWIHRCYYIPVHVYTYNVRLHFKYIRKTISTSIIYICENMKPNNLSLFELYSYKGFIATMFTIHHKSLYYQKFNKKQLQILWPKVTKTTRPFPLLFIYHTPPMTSDYITLTLWHHLWMKHVYSNLESCSFHFTAGCPNNQGATVLILPQCQTTDVHR